MSENTNTKKTKYTKEMCDEMKELMKQGYKDCQLWAHFDISKATFYRWIQEYPEFEEAHEIGLGHCEKYWEDEGIRQMKEGNNKAFNHWRTLVNRKFKWENEGQAGGTTINIQQLNVLNSKSKNQLLSFIKDKITELDILNITPIDDTQTIKLIPHDEDDKDK